MDLEPYFARIGGRPHVVAADLPTLQYVVRQHTEAIAFESLNPFLGLPVPLDQPSVERKLIGQRRGGYCFEQNRLLTTALRAIGYQVDTLIARVLWGQPDDSAVTMRSHMVLMVTIDGEAHLADVGFGGMTLTGALRFEPDVEQSTPHGPFRLLHREGEWTLQALVASEWRTLYRFDLQRQEPIDYEAPNHFTATHPTSRFVQHLIAARTLPDRRLALLDHQFTTHHLGGPTEHVSLSTAAEVIDCLAGQFGIEIADPAALGKLHFLLGGRSLGEGL